MSKGRIPIGILTFTHITGQPAFKKHKTNHQQKTPNNPPTLLP